ncbi:MAG: Wzy polymerase domain-containing protein [Aquabacterium sp.]
MTALPAAAVPPLMAYNLPPSPTLLNQCVAAALWGCFVVALAPRLHGRGTGALQAALGATAVGVLGSWGLGALPAALALSALALLAAAALMAAAGADAAVRADADRRFGWFAAGLLLAGLLSAVVAGVQVFQPDWADGNWIARSGQSDHAIGNLRQPNQLSSVLIWAVIAAIALRELGWLGRSVTAAAVVALVLAVVLTASRTGMVGVAVLAGWGWADRRLQRLSRLLLMASPFIYAAGVLAMSHWSGDGAQAFGVAARVGGDISSSRFGIWSNTLALIAQHPWLGVGFGEFNMAWTLTAFPGRPVAFFDHTHNLPLQLIVELGLPLGLAVLAALCLALVQAWTRASARDDAAAPAARAALMMVLMIGVHSQFEYPLWYAYFLLPAAWAWGFALGRPAKVAEAGSPARGSGLGMLAGAVLVLGGLAAAADYRSVVVIFSPPSGAASLEQRIQRGQRSVLYDHHADYAAATSGAGGDLALALQRAPHYLLDTRLMIAWADALAATGREDQARWLAQRLREFRNPDASDFFAACDLTPAAPPFQCDPPKQAYHWRDFTR